jgi:hypothetical protein
VSSFIFGHLLLTGSLHHFVSGHFSNLSSPQIYGSLSYVKSPHNPS